MNYKQLNNCLCCDSGNLRTILDLNAQPLANSYHKIEENLDNFPLSLNLCLTCKHAQLSVSVDPDLMFKNYLYVSGTTKTLKEYFKWFANYVNTKYDNLDKTVLDIACNDGSQLEEFIKLGYKAYGVDPAENLSKKSISKGVELKVGYWNEEISKDLPKVSFIIAQNVFAHNDSPYDFLEFCKKVMREDSVLFIQTSQANMFDNNEFDTIYHEHISFFCVNSMVNLCDRADMHIEEILKTNVHGTSYVFIIKKTKKNYLTKNVKDNLDKENNRNLEYFIKWSNNVSSIVENLKQTIDFYKKNNYTIVGYGAAAKGNTLLNFGQIKLDYIVDDNEMKHNLLTPGMNIEIKSPDSISLETKILIVPLAWNFFEEIKNKVKKIREQKNTKFLLYFPSVNVED